MIFPIVTPKIDFTNLLKVTNKILGRNINNSVDANKDIVPQSPLAYLCELLELSEENANTNTVGEYNILNALSYGFLTVLESEDIILLHCYTQLHIVCSEEEVKRLKTIVLTGTLMEWKLAVIYFATQSQSTVLQQLAKHLYTYYDHEIGIADTLWKKYRPIFKSDGALQLELK